MKKLGSLFLAFIMLLTLCGCSEESTNKDNGSIQEDSNKIQSEYVGTWKGSKYIGAAVVDDEYIEYYKHTTLLLKEDGTGTYTVTYDDTRESQTLELEWSYDQTNHTIDLVFTKQNGTGAFEIKENDGKTYLQMIGSAPLYRE